MNIYILRLKERPDYHNYNNAKVIVAESEQQARAIANLNISDEGRIWELTHLVSCDIINHNHAHEVLSSFIAG